MQASSFISQSAEQLGYNLRTSTSEQLLEVYQRAIEEMYYLFFDTSPRRMSKSALEVLIKDLGQIGGSIARMRSNRKSSSALGQISAPDGIISHLSEARNALATAADLLNAEDMLTDNRRDAFYIRLTTAQQQLSHALENF